MAQQNNQGREQWASKIGFVLAAAGSAIGLGNIWRFPYKAGQYGGGAFVLAYILATFLIGIPLMIAEFSMGRSTQKSPVGALKKLRDSRFWPLVGWMGICSAFIVLSYYSVVGGWILNYIYESCFSSFQTGMAGVRFEELLARPGQQMLWHFLFMAITVFIVRGGVKSGIEKCSKILMPSLMVILFILMVNSLMSSGAGEGIRFLMKPDFSKLTRAGILEAMGHAFFSLSLGMGAMITYGSYLDKGTNISVSVLQIVALNTFYAIMAGLMVFPVVFTYNVDPGMGPGLFFVTMPEIFARMPGGQIIGFFFFVMVVFAAITSAVSLLEVVVSYFIDQLGWSREKANYLLGSVIFLAGIPSALSSNILKTVTLFGGKNIFDSLDFLASNYIMPIGGLLTAVFVGWVLTKQEKEPELKCGEGSFHFYGIWNVLIKYVVPVALVIVLLYTTGIMNF